MKDLFGLGVFLIFFMFFVFFQPNFFGEPDNYIKANPLQTPTHIVPEWYLTPFYAILRAITFDIWFIPAKLIGVIAMFGSVLILVLVPWLDTSKVRSARFRPIYKQVYWFFVIDCIVLGWVGFNSPDAMFMGTVSFLRMGQVATAYYFLHLLVVLPVLGKLERPRPLPESISASVTKDSNAVTEGA